MFFAKLLSEKGPNTELAYLLWWALGFFFLMVIVGWLVSRRQKAVDREDNLEIIEGIGPKVAKVLKGGGILSFSDLAHASPEKVSELLRSANFGMMDSAGWIEQAKLAATGDMEGLKKMQDEMRSGRLVQA